MLGFSTLAGVFLGVMMYIALKMYSCFYTVGPNERAVVVQFGRADCVESSRGNMERDDFSRTSSSNSDIGGRSDLYNYPKLNVIGPGLHVCMPWQHVEIVSVATQTANIGLGNGERSNNGAIHAVTKDQLDTEISGQIRFRVSEDNLYAYLFGVKNPIAHVMGFFHSVLREKIANYEAPKNSLIQQQDDDEDLTRKTVEGISINDLRKNLQDINEHMERECGESAVHYGIILEAALITNIDPPDEVEQALAAINTAHNEVSSEISVAQADADQTIVQSKRAVEINTLKAQAEVEPLRQLASQLRSLRDRGGLYAYLRNVRLGLLERANSVVLEDRR
jgi:regulator of protease activity HflC (stomatin/prohibitin superfamily)